MLNEDGTLVVVFNGEIYNYKTLRARLQQRGHTFATDSDTEVLLHGYEEWGRDLPCRLRGMFAFAVWDRTRGTLFCARDLFGIKPLCYYKKGETLLFASEIKAFLAHPAFEKRLNEARLPDWLSMEYLPDAETLFTGVYELPPAHTLTWQAGRVTLARYAAPRFRAKRGRSLRDWAREIGDAVAESADAHRIARCRGRLLFVGRGGLVAHHLRDGPPPARRAVLLGGLRRGSVFRAACRPCRGAGAGRAAD